MADDETREEAAHNSLKKLDLDERQAERRRQIEANNPEPKNLPPASYAWRFPYPG